jgi:hypothetical protein
MITEQKIDGDMMYDVANMYTSVMEIGCGECNHLNQITSPVRIGIEGFRQLLNDTHSRGGYKGIVPLCLNLFDIRNVFLDNSMDVVFGFDIVEHFELQDAINIINNCEAIAKEVVMFFIPVGNHPQDYDDRGYGNELNFHRSTWYPQMMEDLGYSVYFDPEFYHQMPNKERGCMFCIKRIS